MQIAILHSVSNKRKCREDAGVLAKQNVMLCIISCAKTNIIEVLSLGRALRARFETSMMGRR